MKNPIRLTLVAASLAILAPQALAQPAASGATATKSEPGKRTDVNTISVTAVVEAVDKATRQVTLKGAEGNKVTVTAGPEVKNFDQIKAGDNVQLRYVEALTLELKPGGKAPVAKTEQAVAAKAQPGKTPAAADGREVR
jgi:hypothetical protein